MKNKLTHIITTIAIITTTTHTTHAQTMPTPPLPTSPINEMHYTPQQTQFTLWAPTADNVQLHLYNTGDTPQRNATHTLTPNPDGTWTTTINGDHKGQYYTFQVTINHTTLPETPGTFAKAVGINGKRAQIINLQDTNPQGWDSDQRPPLRAYDDIIIYEMHHRDYTIHPHSGIQHKGKYLALTETSTTNPQGHPTGIDHLKQLGITHLHILPSYDYGSINEAQTYLRDSLIQHNPNSPTLPPAQYNWGYDPVNYNVPEGSYSTNPYDPTVRIREFKQMVQALHKAGIRVVLDVVYNHVYDANTSPFQLTAPNYYFRHNPDGTLANASGCGNETASEQPMMRKYMIESILYWIHEYHIDGFRFDLMGIHDITTMNAIRQAIDNIDPTIFIYGEGWAATTPALPQNQLALKANITQLPRIAAFGDEMRDALRGTWNNDQQGAFLIGNKGHEESIKYGIVGAIHHPQVDITKVNYTNTPWANQPTQMIAYVSCHDDMCIADRLKTTLTHKAKNNKHTPTPPDTTTIVRLQKLAHTAVLTSQGIPFIWCGDEILRDKHGVHNSYNSPDTINAIPWQNKTTHHDLFTYTQTLIAIRKAHPAFHMGDADKVRANLQFIPTKKHNIIAYQLNGKAVNDTWHNIIVALNSRNTPTTIHIPQGTYTIVCNDGHIDPNGINTITGKTITVAPQSALIIYKNQ